MTKFNFLDLTGLGLVKDKILEIFNSHIYNNDMHVPSGGSEGQLLKRNANGTAEWADISATSAETATKLQTPRNINIAGEHVGSATFDGSEDITINTYAAYSNAIVCNKNNYPWHRFAKTGPITSMQDREIIFMVSRPYRGAGWGLLRVLIRTDASADGTATAQWIIRNNLEADCVKLGFYNINGNVYADLFYKSDGAYRGALFRVLETGTRTASILQWDLINSLEADNTTVDDSLTSYESYVSIENASEVLHPETGYTSIITPTDNGRVAYANSSNSSDTVKTVQLANDADLDTLTNTSFTLYYASHGNAINNNPEAPYGFSLCVHRISGGDIVQELVSQTGNKYIRSYNSSKWKAFKRIACTTDNVASADKLNTDAGSATQPVYFKDGIPVATTYTLGKSVPSDAVFTDTTYSNFVKSGSGAKAGLVPAPSTTAGTTKYLREDGTWVVPPNTTYSNMTAATSSAAGKAGLVPAPAAGKQASFLRGDGTWAVPTDTKYTHPTTAGNKHIPAGGSSGQVLGWSAAGTAAWTSEINAKKASQDGSGNVITSTYVVKKDPILMGGLKHGDSSITSASVSTGSAILAGNSGSKATGYRSLAIGHDAKATGDYSQAYGVDATATGTRSIAMMSYANAIGDSSISAGYGTETQNYQFAIGYQNNTSNTTATNAHGISSGTIFTIGNGTSDSKSNAFRVQGDGKVYAKGAYSATGADYAEYAEWADGNKNNEDRRGYFVTFDEENPTMVRKANAGEYILGIVSGNPCIIGNGDEDWRGRYILDEFGAFIEEQVEEEIDVLDHETGEFVKKTITITKYKENPNYDSNQQYVARAERKEWAAVGWIGVLSVRDDGTCKVGGYCKVADGGIATTAERGIDSYRVMERVTENIVKVVLK